MLTKNDLNEIRKLMRTEITEIIKEEVPPMIKVQIDSLREELDTLIGESDQRVINQIRSEFKYQNEELKKKFHSEYAIGFGKVWEELVEIKDLLSAHILMPNAHSL